MLSNRGSDYSLLLPITDPVQWYFYWPIKSWLLFDYLIFRKYWPLGLTRLHAWGDTKMKQPKQLKTLHFIWNIIQLVQIMVKYANTKFTWIQSVMGSYQILYAIAQNRGRTSLRLYIFLTFFILISKIQATWFWIIPWMAGFTGNTFIIWSEKFYL